MRRQIQSPAAPIARGMGLDQPVLRRQEPRLLDPPVDRLERLFLPPLAVRLRQFDGLDVPRPHPAADRDRLFADPADGVAVPAADHDAADLDAGPVARRGGPRLDRLLGHRDVELRDLPQARRPSRSASNISARSCSISRCSRPGRRFITGSTISCCSKSRSTSASGWRARRRPRSWRCCATSSTRISCSTR